MPLREVYERTTIRTIEHDVDQLGELLTAADPFLIDNDCTSAEGHKPIASCGAIACVHCAKVFWQ